MASIAEAPNTPSLLPNHTTQRSALAEWPTWLVISGHYGLFAALTLFWSDIPVWVSLPLTGYLICLNAHLMHEILHGHPTRNRHVNRWSIFLNLGGWIPYEIYRDTHIAHHKTGQLTDPFDDSESFYVTAARWARLSAPMRWLMTANNSMIGRFLIGPPLIITRFLIEEGKRLASGDPAYRGAWAMLMVSNAILVWWLFFFCRIPVWEFALAWYLGAGLMTVRSYIEHRPAETQDARCAIVEAGPVMQLLFLNNSFHLVHHDLPDLAWYEIPKTYRADRETWRQRTGGHWFTGYHQILWRFGLRPKDSPVHPGH